MNTNKRGCFSLGHGFHRFPNGNMSFNSCQFVSQFCHETICHRRLIGRDKTGVIAGAMNFLFKQKANLEAFEEQVTRGRRLETAVLVKALKLYVGMNSTRRSRLRLDSPRGIGTLSA